ncbi:MAG: hypothetical protein GY810_22680 [Aureispira sp.]|nr:hypothetical protein [Aureispira sp.]
MKTKLVLWGTKGADESTEKVLLALELHPDENKVSTWSFEGELATEEFSEQLLNQWRKGETVAFPEGLIAKEEVLTASAVLLPEGIVVEKDEILKRTQTEWIFIVLSTKLFRNYETSLGDLQEKVEALSAYDKKLWSDLKEFWAAVQAQSREQNLFKEHTNSLRNKTNELFARLKELRSVEDAAFEAVAQTNFDKVAERLVVVEDTLKGENVNLQNLFETLKAIQRDFHGTKLTRALRSKLWERIDSAFKAVKAKRFPGGSSAEGRLSRRIDGLKQAIAKMKSSIDRDERDYKFQTKKLESGRAGQLEAQLAEVKAKMVKDRMDSKQRKLDDMNKTMEELNVRLKKMQEQTAKDQAAAAAKLAKQQAAKEKAEAEAAAKKLAEEAKVEETTVTPTDEKVVEEVKEEAKETVEEEKPAPVQEEKAPVEIVIENKGSDEEE